MGFGYRPFGGSLLNKFLPNRARCFDNEKPRLFGANHALNILSSSSPFFCPRNCIPVASFIARIFPFFLSVIPTERQIHCEKLQALRDPTNPFTLFSFPSRTDHHPRSYFLIVILQISSKGTCSKKRIIEILELHRILMKIDGTKAVDDREKLLEIEDGSTKCVWSVRIVLFLRLFLHFRILCTLRS